MTTATAERTFTTLPDPIHLGTYVIAFERPTGVVARAKQVWAYLRHRPSHQDLNDQVWDVVVRLSASRLELYRSGPHHLADSASLLVDTTSEIDTSGLATFLADHNRPPPGVPYVTPLRHWVHVGFAAVVVLALTLVNHKAALLIPIALAWWAWTAYRDAKELREALPS